MNRIARTSYACIIALGISACTTAGRADITQTESVSILQPPAASPVRLNAHVYLNETRSTLRISGEARNTYGNSLMAGHVHATLRGAHNSVLAERRLALMWNGGTSRLHRGSKKIFAGEIDGEIPADFRLEVAYHTQQD